MLARIAVLVSGGGTNLQALLDAQRAGKLPHGEIVLVLSSKDEVYALERARNARVATKVLPRKEFACQEDFDKELVRILQENRIDMVILAGFMTILGSAVIRAYPDRILNVHPALLPAFGGKGFYGLRVHEAVLAAGVTVTGATVHLVNEVPDGGRILLQKQVPVCEGDTPEILQKRVMEQAEWLLLPQAAEMLSEQIVKGTETK